jgi:hypothetical protein
MSEKRTTRQRVNIDKAILAGPPALNEVVYGYTFPSMADKRIKIGYSSRGVERIVEQSTAYPEKPIVLFLLRDPNAWYLEREFHKAFAAKQSDVMGTEWFDVSMKDVLAVSPALRKAVGMKRGWQAGRWAASALLLGLAALLSPLLVFLFSGVLAGWQQEILWEYARLYVGSWASLDVPYGKHLAAEMMKAPANAKVFPLFIWIPVLLTFALPALPWVFRRKQVM